MPLLEIHPNLKKLIQTDQNGQTTLPINKTLSVPLTAGRFIEIQDYQKAIGLKSWNEFNQSYINRLPLKPILYCSDEDKNRYPTCNAFDLGDTPEKILNHMIYQYHSFYSIRNFPSGRYEFDWWNSGSYIGSLFSRFSQIRHFLDETFYRLIIGQFSTEEDISIARAAFAGMQFLHGVIRTPNAENFENNDERFEKVSLNDGTSLVIEKKWSKDLLEPGLDGRLAVRGIEFDKAIALLTLTSRSPSSLDYIQSQIRVSFADLEKIFLGNQVESYLDLPTVSLINEIFSDTVSPVAFTSKGYLGLGGDPNYRVEVTELMRSIAIQSAILNLEINTVESSDNFASLFYIGRSFKDKISLDIPTLSQLGSPINEPHVMKFWPMQQSLASEVLFEKALMLRFLVENESEASPILADLFVVTQALSSLNEESNESNQQEQAKLESIQNQLIKKLSTVFKKAPSEIDMKQVNILLRYMESQIATAMQLEKLITAYGEQAVQHLIKRLKLTNENTTKILPLAGLAQAALKSKNISSAPEILQSLLPYSPLRSQYGILFSNVEFLAQLVSITKNLSD